jgi:hypothetical protein
LVHAC